MEARQGITTAGLLPRPAGGPERIRAAPAVSREHKIAPLSRFQRDLFGSCHQILSDHGDNVNKVDKSIKHSKESERAKYTKYTKYTKDSKAIVEDARQPAEKPISLRPLEFEEAVESLLRVKKPLATTRKTDS